MMSTDEKCNADLSIPGTASGIPPNSHQPLRTSLTGLTVEEMMRMALSNGFKPRRVVFNTIIWEHWDIFSKLPHIWTVVRKHYDWVKMWVINRDICYVCRPCVRKKGSYEALRFSCKGKPIKLTPGQHLTLEQALMACEQDVHRDYSIRISPWGSAIRMVSDVEQLVEGLMNLGVCDNDIAYLQEREWRLAYAHDVLMEDIDPDEDLLDKIKGKYANLDLLSKYEARNILDAKTKWWWGPERY